MVDHDERAGRTPRRCARGTGEIPRERDAHRVVVDPASDGLALVVASPVAANDSVRLADGRQTVSEHSVLYVDGGYSTKGVAASAWSCGDSYAVTAYKSSGPRASVLAELVAMVLGLDSVSERPLTVVTDCNAIVPKSGMSPGSLGAHLFRSGWLDQTTAPWVQALCDHLFLDLAGFKFVLVLGHDETTPEGLRRCDRLERWARHQLLATRGHAFGATHEDAYDLGFVDEARWDRKVRS